MSRPSRTELLARALQKRDAAQYGPVINGVQHPTWDEIGDMGRDEYLADAKYTVAALAVIDRAQYEYDAEADAKAESRAAEHDHVSTCD
ncbi:hypothetical protein DEJ17_06340 [Curtobacterium sp. MCSS17_011]|uniref:hypothetical protein n=1 Tax=Curtobacterium sp. MCSS17_011 TaxID=2175643 RepID=UPI000D9898F7|nr:hypothetical protein [Curtobacterium sp. MCSS17_011]PYY59984.1 hypothetical protein DEJ17_06340 [Curtobacterium sp. MCSS17_011]